METCVTSGPSRGLLDTVIMLIDKLQYVFVAWVVNVCVCFVWLSVSLCSVCVCVC